jgi:hemerythrin-like metal-binding protein
VHFSDEEHLMQQRRSPGFDVHQREHQGYRERLAKLRDEYIAGMRDEVVSEAVWLAAEWFVGHIKRADLAMAEYVRKNRQA